MREVHATADAHEQARRKLIVALDVASSNQARTIVSMLRGAIGMFKIGSQLFTSAGPEMVREIIAGGDEVFLDLKFHDIPNTVAAAATEATRLGVSIFNVHAVGGMEMMTRAREAVVETAAKEGLTKPALIAVTVLTSANAATMREVGVTTFIDEQVIRLAQLTEAAGLDGVVASPIEIELLRRTIPDRKFLLVTPGVRPTGASADDQKRTMSPREAISAGADYLVVGRPILSSKDPVAAVRSVIEEMAKGLTTKEELN